MRRLAACLALGFLLAFVVGLSPHLVHHAFGHGDRGHDCPLATSIERLQASVVVIVLVVAPSEPISWLTAAGDCDAPRVTPAPTAARAPPALSS